MTIRLTVIGAVLTVVHLAAFSVQMAPPNALDVIYGSWIALLAVYVNSKGWV